MKRGLLGCLLFFAPCAAAQDVESGTPAKSETEIEVVTPGGSKKKLLDTPDSVTTLDRRQIQERMAGQTPDLLEGTTGVYIQHTAAGQGSPFIRGRTGKEIVMLVNGVRFSNSMFRGGPNQYYATIGPDTIERIEVIRGPASVLYGSDALGGVLNIITRKPTFEEAWDYTFGARARFESSSMRKQGGTFAEFGSPHFGGIVDASYADVDELVGGSSIGRQPYTSYEEWGIYGNFGTRWGNHTVDFNYSHFQQHDINRTDRVSPLVANPALLPAPGVGRDKRRLFVWQIDDLAMLNWRYEPDGVVEEMFVDLMYHKVQESLQRIRNNNPNRLEDSNFNVHTLGFRSQAVLNFGTWARLTVGGEVYHDMVNSRSIDIDRTTKEQTNEDGRVQVPDWSSYTSFGIYAQNETTFFDEMLQFRYGVRFSGFRALADVDLNDPQIDGVNTFVTDITGAFAMIYQPIDEVSITLNLSRGFRAPNLDELAASKGFGAGEAIPNPNLDPETQWSVDVGAKMFIPTQDAKSAAPYEATGSLVFFFNYLEDTLIRESLTYQGVDVFRSINGGRGRIFGFEADFGFYLSEVLGWIGLPTDHLFFEGDALGFNANFTYTRGDDLKNDEPIGRIPPVFSEVSMRYSAMNGKLFLEPYMNIVGRQDQYNSSAAGDPRFTPHDAPGYVTFGLRAGWTPCRNVRFNLNIQNIGNRSYHPMGSGTFGTGTNVVLSGEIKW
ncbi:MAG: TonB-dependent receptor [Planctomycetes bacterium]|nr:TonB-dependent receptor [Planctomycetota bacterium]